MYVQAIVNGSVADVGDYVVSYDYDANGNMTEREVDYNDAAKADESWSYGYDADDRMVVVRKDGDVVAEYGYDALGRRVVKDVAGEAAEIMFYQNDEVVEEWSIGKVSKRFVHGPGLDDYVALIRPEGVSEAGTYYYHADGLGSITGISKGPDGSIYASYEYRPFGDRKVLSGSSSQSINSFEYTGRRFDQETDLMFYRSRYYIPGSRKFTQEDTWTGLQMWPGSYINKYSYVTNNPINLIDPYGEGWPIILVAIALIALAAPPSDDPSVGPWDEWRENPIAAGAAEGIELIEPSPAGEIKLFYKLVGDGKFMKMLVCVGGTKKVSGKAKDILRGKLKREFPTEYLDNTLEEIEVMAKVAKGKELEKLRSAAKKLKEQKRISEKIKKKR